MVMTLENIYPTIDMFVWLLKMLSTMVQSLMNTVFIVDIFVTTTVILFTLSIHCLSLVCMCVSFCMTIKLIYFVYRIFYFDLG